MNTRIGYKTLSFARGYVAIRFKMLTYSRVRSAFEANRAVPSNKIKDFETNAIISFDNKACYFYHSPDYR